MSGENIQLTLFLMQEYKVEPYLALQTVNDLPQDSFDELLEVVGKDYLNKSVLRQIGTTKLNREAVRNILLHRKVTPIEINGAVALVQDIT